jgi:hypothetical protein
MRCTEGGLTLAGGIELERIYIRLRKGNGAKCVERIAEGDGDAE